MKTTEGFNKKMMELNPEAEQDFIQNLIKEQCKSLDNKLKGKVIEALNAHGHNIDEYNYIEVLERSNCKILTYNEIHTLYVNEKPICIWTDWKLEPHDITENPKFNMTFKFETINP